MDITEFIEDHSPGKSEAGRMLGKLIDAVRDTGKGGSMTLVIKIEPDKAQPATGLLISDEITAKLPKHERPVRKAWMTKSGLVVDFDPDAPSLPGMAVDGSGGLVDLTEEEVQASARHFLQHTTGIHFDPGAGETWKVSVEEEDVAAAEAEELPGEEAAPDDIDPASPFALTDARALRVVKDQPQA